jgi:hypothetical protein
MNYYLEPHTKTLYVYYRNWLIATLPRVAESSAFMLADEVYAQWEQDYLASGGKLFDNSPIM